MIIHKEGRKLLFILAAAFTLLNLSLHQYLPEEKLLNNIVLTVTVVLFLLVLQFFRIPNRRIEKNADHVLAPADGKVVVIEEVEEPEYFQGKRLQVSIFMSPLNVHNNRTPVAGEVKYFKYHPGKFLMAWDPKSSTDNERTTVVVGTDAGVDVLFRQIAGAMARRICWYIDKGQRLEQGDEFGFIKFGSRVDVFLPLGTEVNVNIGDKTVGGKTVIATFS